LDKKDYEKAYFQALNEDLKFHIQDLNIPKHSIKTLFIGGGTPSIISAKFYEELFSFLQPYLKQNSENTIEANPGSTTKSWLKAMFDFKINRISFGAQSFNEEKLKFLGRIHKQKEILQSLELAHKIGFKNINIDMIYDTKYDDKKMLDFELLNLNKIKNLLTHISAYNLSIEANTAFAKKIHFKKNAPRLMTYFINNIENLGFKQYEISNFGKICKHNLAYWQGKPYLACGLSGVGFYNKQRFYTVKDLKTYIQNPTFRKTEKLSSKDLNLEHLFLGLRSCVGVNIKKLSSEQIKKANFLVKNKKLIFKKNKFYNTNYLISDEIALFLST